MPNLLLDIPGVAEEAFSRRRRAASPGGTDASATLEANAASARADTPPRPIGCRMGQLSSHSRHAPCHARIYYDAATRARAVAANQHLCEVMARGGSPRLLFVGSLKDGKAGPHPVSQFEIHFTRDALADVRAFIEATGFTALLHSQTDDDVADHTTFAEWIGTPVTMDLTTLDPPGRNQGLAHSGVSDF